MPYASLEKQREASRLAMRKHRQKRKEEWQRLKMIERQFRHNEKVLRNIDQYEFFIGKEDYAVVPKEHVEEFLAKAPKLGINIESDRMKHFIVVEDTNTSVLRTLHSQSDSIADFAPLWEEFRKDLMVTSFEQDGKIKSYRVAREVHEQFAEDIRSKGYQQCYVQTLLELAWLERKPILYGAGNIFIVNIYPTYHVEKPRRVVHIKEREMWLGNVDGKGDIMRKEEWVEGNRA